MRSGAASIDELVAHGGWALDDAQARHRANPDTFWLPPPDQLAALLPGTQARLVFQLLDQADPVVDGVAPYGTDGHPTLVVAHERMWLWIESRSGPGPEAELVGILLNLPAATHCRLVPGARVRFRLRDVIDLELAPSASMADELAAMAEVGFPALAEAEVAAPEDPHRAPTIAPGQAEVCARHNVRPERPHPSPFVRALVGRSLAEGAWPVYGGRRPPNAERGDSGWTVWAEHPDLAEAEAAAGFEVLPVIEVRGRHREAWRHLALPPGWAFVLGPDGSADVYQDPSLLEQ